MKLENMIEVMEHKKRGGRVETDSWFKGVLNWIDCPSPSWNWSEDEYRIHPEEKAVIDHFNNGGEIEQYSDEIGWFKWHLDEYPSDWGKYKYRIKPKHIKLQEHLSDCKKPSIKVPEKFHSEMICGDKVYLYSKANQIIETLNAIVERLDEKG